MSPRLLLTPASTVAHSMVERSIAWLTRGNRKLGYRGVVKNAAWLHLRVAAIILRRLLTLGLTARNGAGPWSDACRHGRRGLDALPDPYAQSGRRAAHGRAAGGLS